MPLDTTPYAPGDRVRFVGIALLGIPFGAEGTVRHVDGPRGTFVVEFPQGLRVLWPVEMQPVEGEGA